MASHWKALVVEKRSRQQLAIPKDWVLKELPPKDVIDVTQFPEASGLLSTKEIDITTTRVDVLLEKLASGYWSSVDVTTAFSKRAIIAHQLVSVVGLVTSPDHDLLPSRPTASPRYSLIALLPALLSSTNISKRRELLSDLCMV